MQGVIIQCPGCGVMQADAMTVQETDELYAYMLDTLKAASGIKENSLFHKFSEGALIEAGVSRHRQ